MTRPQKQLLILGVLGVVMVAVYARAFRRAPPQPARGRVDAAQEPAVSPVQETTLAVIQPSGQREMQRQHAQLLAWRRDPFTRGAALGELSGLELSGILWDPGAPLAVINGQMVGVGQDVDGYQVVDISPDRVSLTDGTQTFQLTIAP